MAGTTMTHLAIASLLYGYLLHRAGVRTLAIGPIVAFNALVLVLLAPVSMALGVAGSLVIGVLSYVACLPWRVRTSPMAIGVVAAVNLSVLFFLWPASPVLATYGLIVSATASGLSYLVNTPLRP